MMTHALLPKVVLENKALEAVHLFTDATLYELEEMWV